MAIGNLVAFADPARAQTNIAAWNLINQVNGLNREIAIRQLRLATGKQQPRVEDGASFFTIWNKMKNQVRGKEMAIDNIGDAKDELSLAEAGMLQVDDMLGKMRDLLVRSASDTLTDEQREDVRQELLNLYMTISNIATRTRFNEGGAGEDGLLDGFSHTYQVGPNETELDRYVVEIENILAGVTRAFSPELGEKLDAMAQVLDGIPFGAGENMAEEIRDYTSNMPAGGVRRAIEELANAFAQPEKLQSSFLVAISKLSPEEMVAFDAQLEELFTTRLDTSGQNSTLTDFLTDAEVAPLFQNLTPAIADLIGNPATQTALADSLQAIAGSPEILSENLENELQDVSDAIRALSDTFTTAIGNLESLVDGSLDSESQRLFLGQDIVFYASSAPVVAGHPKVQEVLNQLALDVANDTDGMPNFVAAIGTLNAEERGALSAALNGIVTDSQNGLSFHLAVPDLDGPGGPFSIEAPNSFAAYALNIQERTPDPEDTDDLNLAGVLAGAANEAAAQFPGVANQLNRVIGLLTDNDDSNDDVLVEALRSLGSEIVTGTITDITNFATIFRGAANALAVAFPGTAGNASAVADLIESGADSAALGAAISALGAQIEADTGTSSFFTNPIGRGTIRNAFLGQTGTQAFADLTPGLQGLFTSMTDAVINQLDLDGPGGTFSQTEGTFGWFLNNIGPVTNTNLAARDALRTVFLNQTNSAAFSNLSPATQATYLAMADGLVQLPDLVADGAPFSQTDNTFAQTAANIRETNPVPNPPVEDTDDNNLAALLQGVAANIAGSFTDVAALMNQAAILLTDNNDENDAELAATLTALAAQIENDTLGEADIDGAARAELRKVFLEQTATPAFNDLTLTGKAAYLTMAEGLGAYTVGQAVELDNNLRALAETLNPDTTALENELAELGEVLTDETLTREGRNALIVGLTQAANAVGNSVGDENKILALRNVLDDPSNGSEPNPSDLVGQLARHVPDALNSALQAVLASPIDRDLGDAVRDFMEMSYAGDASALLGGADNAINFVKDELINLGGVQTKLTSLESIMSQSAVSEDSVASRFGDADLAKEQVELAKLQLFSQLATAQAAAANMAPSQLVGGLLGG